MIFTLYANAVIRVEKMLNIKNLKYCLLVMLLIGAATGCGYSSRSILKQNVGTVYIPIFDNETFRRGLEFGLTKALKDEIMFKTQLKIANKEDADSIIEGVVVKFDESVMIVDSEDNIMESRIFIRVDFIWRDLRSGRAIVQYKGVTSPTEFVVKRGETIESAKNEAYVDIAERIVDLMNERW